MGTQRLMKDGLGEAAIARMASAFAGAWRGFPRDKFTALALVGLGQLELKQRVNHLIEALQQVLPESFERQAEILTRIPDHWDPGDPEDSLRGFAAWPIIDLVSVTGLANSSLALETLRKLTPLFSAEFSIRPFLIQDWKACQRHLERWTRDPNEHVRRLVSEGTRPRLPWGMQLKFLVDDPSTTLSLLEALRDDPSEYVRRSVANHLNDIGKDHPDLVVKICGEWGVQPTPEREALIRHATRSLIKAGHKGALALHGADQAAKVVVEEFSVLHPVVRHGGHQVIRLRLRSTARKAQRLVVDFAVHHQKADGSTRCSSGPPSISLRARPWRRRNQSPSNPLPPGGTIAGTMAWICSSMAANWHSRASS
jgi:3-methyladenine DNA glycosylase AlkC